MTSTVMLTTHKISQNQRTCRSDDMALRPIALHLFLTLATPSSADSAIRVIAWHHSCNSIHSDCLQSASLSPCYTRIVRLDKPLCTKHCRVPLLKEGQFLKRQLGGAHLGEVRLGQALDLLQLLAEEGQLVAHVIHPPAHAKCMSMTAQWEQMRSTSGIILFDKQSP